RRPRPRGQGSAERIQGAVALDGRRARRRSRQRDRQGRAGRTPGPPRSRSAGRAGQESEVGCAAMADEPTPEPKYKAVDGVDVHFDGTVLRCALNRPKTRNSVDSGMMLGLIEAVETAALDER